MEQHELPDGSIMSPRQRSAETKRRRSRQAIVDAGRFLLKEDGPSMRVEDVASEAGLSVPTFYSYFNTKADLVASIFYEDVLEPVRDVTFRLTSDEEVPQQLELVTRVLGQAVHKHYNLVRAALAARYEDAPEGMNAYHMAGSSTSIWWIFDELANVLISACNAWPENQGTTDTPEAQAVVRAANAVLVGVLDQAMFHAPHTDLSKMLRESAGKTATGFLPMSGYFDWDEIIPVLRSIKKVRPLPSDHDSDEWHAAFWAMHDYAPKKKTPKAKAKK